MEQLKKYLPWIIRIIIFILFMVSAVAKMFPIYLFEKQLVDLGITSWCYAPYLSRLIIALEIAIALAILQNHFIKRFVIPVTILLLVAFCVHLSIEMVKNGAMNGNCGCFGQLIPMTPLEAFIKNILTIGLLIYLYFNVSEKEQGQNKFSYLLLIYFASAFAMFAIFPFCPCKEEIVVDETSIIEPEEIDTLEQDIVPMDTVVRDNTAKEEPLISTTKKDSVVKPKVNPGPKQTKSKYAEFKTFGSKTVNLDQGKKIVCLFVPGCDHCRDAAKELKVLAKDKNFPPIYVLFMNEEVEKIPDFFKEVQTSYPYTVLEIPQFFKLLGNNANTPGINYMWNGNIIKYYEGSGDNKLKPEELKGLVNSN